MIVITGGRVMSNVLTPECINNLERDLKISFIVTKGKDGYPHITFINSLQAKNEKELIWAQNSQGESKANMPAEPKTALLVLNLSLEMWRGRALWKRAEISGADFDMYNNKPINRYNAYGAISKVHYMDLVEMGTKEKLNMVASITGALHTRIAAPKAARKDLKGRVMRPYAEKLMRSIKSLKFMAYIGEDGFPVIVPVIQGRRSR